jgi:hypothetical protein
MLRIYQPTDWISTGKGFLSLAVETNGESLTIVSRPTAAKSAALRYNLGEGLTDFQKMGGGWISLDVNSKIPSVVFETTDPPDAIMIFSGLKPSHSLKQLFLPSHISRREPSQVDFNDGDFLGCVQRLLDGNEFELAIQQIGIASFTEPHREEIRQACKLVFSALAKTEFCRPSQLIPLLMALVPTES